MLAVIDCVSKDKYKIMYFCCRQRINAIRSSECKQYFTDWNTRCLSLVIDNGNKKIHF